MTKFTVVMSLIAIGCLLESVEPCTDDFVKQMAVSVCGLSKRSFDGAHKDWSIFGPFRRIFGLNFGRISNVDREYRRLIGDVDEAEFLLRGVSGDKKPKEEHDDDRHSAVSKRDIMALVRECCYRKCTVDDFKGICDKK